MKTIQTLAIRRRSQRGVAALTVALLLLSVMALIAFFANRSLLFEQKSSANQYRAARAFEMAEAGLEWATAMLNEPRPIDANCVPAAAGLSFRDKYVPSDAALALVPLAGARPSCRVTAGALVCSCPDAGQAPSLGAVNDPSFSVAFAGVAADTASVQINSLGCTGLGTQCVPGSTQGRADAVAQVSVALKLRPLLRALPAAPLTAGGAVTIGGPASLANLDGATQGGLVVAGQTVDVGSTALTTLPGSPPANALLGNDSVLDALARQASDGSAVFNAFFGMTPTHLRHAAPLRVIGGSSAAARSDALRAAYEQGYSAFVVDGDLTLDASGIGSAARPVLIVSAFAVACSAPCPVTGMLYADIADRDASDLANLGVQGAVVTRGRHSQPLGGAIAYDPAVLKTLRHRNSIFVRVPGSWRDY
jgi:Tfp pilus assembly protein PilX